MPAKTTTKPETFGVGNPRMTEEHLRRLQVGVDDARRRGMTPKWLDEQRQRMTVVNECAVCGKELIAEEVDAHRRSHLSAKARRIVGMVDLADEATQEEIRAYLQPSTSAKSATKRKG